jgi:hypothetical protein
MRSAGLLAREMPAVLSEEEHVDPLSFFVILANTGEEKQPKLGSKSP